ncbi:sigma-70 family RNA polymerase sigma factor [Mariniphaga sediminis]|jgi:RNA polymerase sigma-70 factor (ECF subfamily)|uniref:Sigma-70 family RNA polymerase sigma factor n=1 Tax=Mariniphaga sediminis TaxID=1628158 RepID=A0A399CY65_9BACT|nr:sigma-70 family RNA polymerase sigma factor [Mariniphaga sediminis]RIH63422.1 sigma-70 family RNA polymerase sigma factor [Mariniphaga sediminis]
MTKIQFNNALLNLRKKLYIYAISLTSDSEQASDLLQETMLKVLIARDKFTQNTNFKAWVYTIMRNTFINDYRRILKTRNKFVGSSIDFCYLVPTEKNYPTPDSIYHTREIHRNIEALEDEYRIPFTMFFEGYKYKEIAKKLDLPLGTVKSRIFFTRKKLKKTLREYSDS